MIRSAVHVSSLPRCVQQLDRFWVQVPGQHVVIVFTLQLALLLEYEDAVRLCGSRLCGRCLERTDSGSRSSGNDHRPCTFVRQISLVIDAEHGTIAACSYWIPFAALFRGI
jgi:hypothetical protein